MQEEDGGGVDPVSGVEEARRARLADVPYQVRSILRGLVAPATVNGTWLGVSSTPRCGQAVGSLLLGDDQ